MENITPSSASHKNTAKAIPQHVNNNQLLSRREAAAYLGIAENTLAIWKCQHRYDLPYVKVGRLVRYRKIDLDAFIAKRLFGAQ
jgi:excisionase family DNA binding protein